MNFIKISDVFHNQLTVLKSKLWVSLHNGGTIETTKDVRVGKYSTHEVEPGFV